MKVRNAFQEYKQMDRVIRAAVILCIAALMILTQNIIAGITQSKYLTVSLA